MDKIYHIWDTLLVSPDWMPIVFAFAVIHELRDQILEQDFNQVWF